MDGELETIKRVCWEAALTLRTFVTPSISLGSPPTSSVWMGSQRQFKRVYCEAAFVPETFMAPSIAF